MIPTEKRVSEDWGGSDQGALTASGQDRIDQDFPANEEKHTYGEN